MHRSSYKHRKLPQSYELSDNDNIDDFTEEETDGDKQHDYDFALGNGYDEHLIGGLMDYMNLLKKRKLKKIVKCQQDHYNDVNVTHEDIEKIENEDDVRTEIDFLQRFAANMDTIQKKRSLREKEYIVQEQKHIQKVHKELCDINEKLQHENKRLRQWDLELRKRELRLDKTEKELADYAASLEEMIEAEVEGRCKNTEEVCETKIQQIQNENKKTRNAFKILRKANETLKKQSQSDSVKLNIMEEKQTALTNRISNLQRKNEILQQQINERSVLGNSYQVSKEKQENLLHKKKESVQSNLNGLHDVFSSLLQWVSDVHLKENVNRIMKAATKQTDYGNSEENTNERCMKILLSFPPILHEILTLNENIQLSFVSFIYWSLIHAHLTQSSQKFAHSTTYRRIGEELYCGKGLGNNKIVNTEKSFFGSDNVRIRLMSSLIILHTVSQADITAHVFNSLTSDLSYEQCKAVFVENYGVVFLLPMFKLTNKIHLALTTKVLMCLTAESPYSQDFMAGLSCVEWIQAIVSIMKSCQDDVALLEQLCLILQRLSKIRSNKSIFDALQVYNIVSELQRTCDPTEDFLMLNLRSILFNIDAVKSKKIS